MNSVNTNTFVAGGALAAGVYLAVRAGSRLWRTVTVSASSSSDTNSNLPTRDIVLGEVCTVSMGALGATLLLVGVTASHQ